MMSGLRFFKPITTLKSGWVDQKSNAAHAHYGDKCSSRYEGMHYDITSNLGLMQIILAVKHSMHTKQKACAQRQQQKLSREPFHNILQNFYCSLFLKLLTT